MRLLLDTHVLIWIPTGDPRLSATAHRTMQDSNAALYASSVTAFELADLQKRGRVAMREPIETVAAPLGLTILDFPAEAWTVASRLPDLHRDPVDRMMIAHAIVGDFTLVTADKTIRRYPVKSIW